MFERCEAGNRVTCVVDGDTFWWRGRKVRIEAIDAPELHNARCEAERALAIAAADRLVELLNQGGWRLVQLGDRNVDQYGRQLRTIELGESDMGEMLVSEGLARRWEGQRQPWCEG